MPYRPTARTEARNRAMRHRLVSAARGLFIEQGYDATTLSQIVRLAKTSIGNCYFYFPNKEALLNAIAEEFCAEISEEIEEEAAISTTGIERLAAKTYAVIVAACEQADVARVVLVETRLPTIRTRFAHLFADILRETTEEDLGGTELTDAVWLGTVFSALEGYITGRIQEDPSEIARFVVRWNLRAIGTQAETVEQVLSRL